MAFKAVFLREGLRVVFEGLLRGGLHRGEVLVLGGARMCESEDQNGEREFQNRSREALNP